MGSHDDSQLYSNQYANVCTLPPDDGVYTAQKEFVFIALLFTWREEDVISATVRNLYAQGCDVVFIIDNGSTDNTLQNAVAAGAVHYDTVESIHFSEGVKCKAVFDCTRRVLADCGGARTWCFFVDADEFPSAPSMKGAASDNREPPRIRDYIARQDDRIRCIGGHFINHYPLHFPHYVPGFHPAEFQFEGLQHVHMALYCNLYHDKHNLLRFDDGHFDLHIYGGYHRFQSHEPLWEPARGIIIHHVNFRSAEKTLGRLMALNKVDARGYSRLGDAAYNQKLAEGLPQPLGFYKKRLDHAFALYNAKNKEEIFDLKPCAWPLVARALGYEQDSFHRWYSETSLFRETRRYCESLEKPLVFPVWELSWSMHYKSPQEFLTCLYGTPKTHWKARHLWYAAKVWRALGSPHKAEECLQQVADIEEGA